jgi:DNA gyrase/topoisomerase IV subunit B
MDADAIHITSMILGWFKRFAPNLYKEHRICKLITPLIFLTNNKNKVIKYFFDITSFKKWEEQNKDSKLNIIYVKGLGSLEKSHINQIIEEKGIEYFVQPFELDDEGNLLLVDWLGDNVEKRKQYLKEYSLDVNNV